LQIIQTGTGLIKTLLQIFLLDFQFCLEGTPDDVHLTQLAFLYAAFFEQGDTFLFTGTVLAFHIIDFAFNGLIFAAVAHLHTLAFALLDARGVIRNIQIQPFLLFSNML